MSDLKLFQISNQAVKELEGKSVSVEKELQNLMEENLEVFLGVKFLATEYSTGRIHGGRIDTLGLDENYCPVIIEYKRSSDENVINQGLYYLDWLLDHKGDFELLVQKELGKDFADKIEWNGTRLICIAGDFKKYDNHAIKQIQRNIELIKYKKYDEHLLLELVGAFSSSPQFLTSSNNGNRKTQKYKTVREFLNDADGELTNLFEDLKNYMLALGDDVSIKELMYYFAFSKIKNFASVEVHPKDKELVVCVKLDINKINFEDGFSRDVTNIGHLGTGNVEIRIKTADDLEKAKPLIQKSYDGN